MPLLSPDGPYDFIPDHEPTDEELAEMEAELDQGDEDETDWEAFHAWYFAIHEPEDDDL